MKTLVITGACEGVGLATADLFQEQGYTVVNISPHRGGFEHGAWICADVAERGWLDAAEGQLVAAVQHATEIVVVHNAAQLPHDDIEGSSDAGLQRVWQANVLAPVQLNRLLLPYMDEGSSIIYVCPAPRGRIVSKRLSYEVCRHARVGLMRATALEIETRAMHTACICPDIAYTDSDRIEPHNVHGATARPPLRVVEVAQLVWFAAHNRALGGAVIDSGAVRADS